MTLPLFIYGTLLDPDLFRRITRTPLATLRPRPARAEGHVAVYAFGKPFPVLAQGEGHAEGLLIEGLSPAHWRALDAYEGREWQRTPLAVVCDGTTIEAVAYTTTAFRPSREKFTLAGWQARLKSHYMARLG